MMNAARQGRGTDRKVAGRVDCCPACRVQKVKGAAERGRSVVQ